MGSLELPRHRRSLSLSLCKELHVLNGASKYNLLSQCATQERYENTMNRMYAPDGLLDLKGPK